MNVDQALKLIADSIWTHGEIDNGDGCLIPVGYHFGVMSDFNRASTVLYDEYKATHFSLKWMERGTWVEITLFKGDAFGACIDLELAAEPFYVPV